MAKRRTTDAKSKGTPVKSGDIVARRKRRDDEPDSGKNLAEVKWWLSPNGTDAAGKLWTWIERLRSQWAVDGIADLIHEAIYADEPIMRGGMFDGRQWHGSKESGTCILNVLKSVVDTGTAHLTKVRSMPVISARNATYAEKRFATQVSGVLRTKMGGEDLEQMAPLIIRDFLIRGTGVIKTERDGGDTRDVRVPIYEIVYDHREASFVQRPALPSTLAHVRPESRERMVKRFPDYAEQINDAALFTRLDPWMQFVYQGPALADLVEVAESWHPPIDADDEHGQRIVCIRGTTVLREPWLSTRYPLQFPYWTAPIRGVRGKGLIAEHSAAQDLINGILHDAREGIRDGSQLKVFTPRGSNVNKNHLRPGSPKVVEVDGPPGAIQFIAADPVSKQAWSIAFQIKDEIYNTSGISQWSATANKPLGEGASGKALDTMNDNQSDRFAQVETNWQQTRVAVGRANVDLARHMWLEAHGKVEHRFDEQPDPIDKKDLAPWIRDNAWDKVELDSGAYHLTLEPENFLTGTRGGRLEEIAEAAKAGLIPDPSMTAGLMDEPDIQRMNRPILGPLHRIEQCLSGLADLGVDYIDIAPDNAMNRPLAKLMALGELEEAKADKAPDEVVQRFVNFLADLKSLDDAAAVAAQQGMQAAPSLAGAQQNTTVNQGNAASLMGGGAPPMGAGPSGMPPGAPPGMPPGPGMPS